MMITSFEIFRYSLPLIKPLFLPTEKITVRAGLILKLMFDGDTQGFGEIAPLPGFSDSGINECLENLKEACPVLIQGHFSGPNLEEDFLPKLDKIRVYSAVRFGVEMAILNASATQKRLPLSKFLSAHAADKIILNGLLADSKESMEYQVERLLQKGYKLIKVKARGKVTEDIKRLTDVLRAVNNRAQVHVDVNQKWSFEDAILFTEKMKGCNIKYIEEPFSDISKIPDFFKKTGIPIALDESLVSRGLLTINLVNLPEGVKFLILKPTLLGGIRKTLRIMHDAARKGIQSIVSSSFESDIGISTLIHLAAIGGKDITAGLDTLKWFKKRLLKKPQEICEGKITIPERNISENDIRREYLTKILL